MLVTAPAYGRPVHPDQVSRDVEDIAGELIAALVTGEPLPLPTNVVQALATGRFLARDLKRRQSAR